MYFDGRRGSNGFSRALKAALVISTALALSVPATPANAGLLGTTLDLVDDTLDTTTRLVDATTGLVVGENGLLSGWIYDDTSTSMAHVNDVVGASKMWRKG